MTQSGRLHGNVKGFRFIETEPIEMRFKPPALVNFYQKIGSLFSLERVGVR
jgi:hypothetical protein